ncbi:DUF262 domain-containing protein [Lewinella sp. LCG006]|uniref:GmrSD restriction endonuclease domain-containing protein n=1 Tax=Lewinella sp. LCG006 TaxID=3231911 RepID=UPI0034611F09
MKISFTEVLKNKIEIPIIQRDYAQGRKDDKTSKIRRDFLDVIFESIATILNSSAKKKLELDFIYGFNQEGDNYKTFTPIDGQQRLTTLWLLYWFVSAKENVAVDEKAFLTNFVYETRHSTTVFCDKLLDFQPGFENRSIKAEVMNQPWYFDTWDYDPSIQAMLVVLEEIEVRYTALGEDDIWNILENENCPFYFYKLDMDKVGLSDDLYIKMNSRGKALTEFEYFKAGFSDIITDENLKQRFEDSVDREWMDCIWKVVKESEFYNTEIDIALTVDNSFLNFFNYFTYVLALKNDLPYKDTVESLAVIKEIYKDEKNLLFLFDILDAIVEQQNSNSTFWDSIFYYDNQDFDHSKTRLFFPHEDKDLLHRCLLYYDVGRGLSYPEQLLLYACLIHLKGSSENFPKNIRIVRNLVANSENELRERVLGKSFSELEAFILDEDLEKVKNFKTDQIEEEKGKRRFITQNPPMEKVINSLEDSDIFRGCISIFDLDDSLNERAPKFLNIFDEEEIKTDFINRSNLLLCFGDYSQKEGNWYNLLSPARVTLRRFFTTPGYGKEKQIFSNTKPVLMECLDFFIQNSSISIEQHLDSTLSAYESKPKDWKYYFLKYPSFRIECHDGYYWWNEDTEYELWKMRRKRFNGFNWQPYLYEIVTMINSEDVRLENYNFPLDLSNGRERVNISTIEKGFLFKDEDEDNNANSLIQQLIEDEIITEEGLLEVEQNDEGLDLEDRIVKLKEVIQDILNND